MGFIADAIRRDYGDLTPADVAMMRRAMQAGGDEVDFSEFYLDEDGD